MIKIVCVGKIKESFYRDAVDEYKKRLSKYTDIEIVEVPDEGLTDQKTTLKKESEKLRQMFEVLKKVDCTQSSPLRTKLNEMEKLKDEYSANILCEAVDEIVS